MFRKFESEMDDIYRVLLALPDIFSDDRLVVDSYITASIRDFTFGFVWPFVLDSLSLSPIDPLRSGIDSLHINATCSHELPFSEILFK